MLPYLELEYLSKQMHLLKLSCSGDLASSGLNGSISHKQIGIQILKPTYFLEYFIAFHINRNINAFFSCIFLSYIK